jgi:hypothetical protein
LFHFVFARTGCHIDHFKHDLVEVTFNQHTKSQHAVLGSLAALF